MNTSPARVAARALGLPVPKEAVASVPISVSGPPPTDRNVLLRMASTLPVGHPMRVAVIQVLAEEAPADDAKPKGKRKGPPAGWDEFLKEVYGDVHRLVPNPNTKTQKKYPKVQFLSSLRDKATMAKVMKEYAEWKKKNQKDEGAKKKKKLTPEEEQNEKLEKMTFGSGGKALADMSAAEKKKVENWADSEAEFDPVAEGQEYLSAKALTNSAIYNLMTETGVNHADAVKALAKAEEKAKKKKPDEKKSTPEQEKPEKSKKPDFLPNNPSAWDEWGEKHNTYRNKWSFDAKESMLTYTGDDYTDINNHLRNGADTTSELATVIKHMDKVFETAKLPVPVTVARGLSKSNSITKQLNAGTLEVGTTIEDPGYVSTSIKPWEAHNWDSKVRLTMTVPKGAKAIYLGPPPRNDDEAFSSVPNEYELLLARGTKMRVTKIDKSTTPPTVEVEVLT